MATDRAAPSDLIDTASASAIPDNETKATNEDLPAVKDGKIVDNQSSWALGNATVPAALTWEDVRVTVSDVTGRRKDILQGVSGYVQPGELLGILGSSGSGKTTLLDTLSGRLAKNASFSGSIRANGKVQQLAYGASAYVSQDDVLIGVLTVYETINFAASLRLPLNLSRAQKRARVDEVIAEMGLTECAHTPIGNWHVRGVSGGQKRRVSIAMELVTKPSLLFLDEPTSGLDSAAAYHVMAAVRQLAVHHNRTIIAVVHQPSAEVFDQLDTLCLLSGGRTVYFGRADEAVRFVEEAGLPRPPHINIADYLLHLTNRDFDASKTNSESADGMTAALGGIFASDESRTATIGRLVDAYSSSSWAVHLEEKVRALSAADGAPLSRAHEESLRFTLYQILILTSRGALNCVRNLGVWWLRIGMYIGLMLCMGTIYFRLGYGFGDIYSRVGAIAFIACFFPFQCIAGFPAFVDDLKIFHRERLNGYYGVFTFCVSYTLSSLPFLLLLSLIASVVGYWLMNLNNAAEAFIYFFLLFSASMLVAESLMMTIAAVIPNFFWGIIVWAALFGVFMLVCGFFRLAGDLPAPVWRYPLHYVSPTTWWYEGYMLNEFDGQTFSGPSLRSAPVTSLEVLRTFGLGGGGIIGGHKWANLAAAVGWAILYRALFVIVLKLKQRLPPIKTMAPLVLKLFSSSSKARSGKKNTAAAMPAAADAVAADADVTKYDADVTDYDADVSKDMADASPRRGRTALDRHPKGVSLPSTVLTWQDLSISSGRVTLLHDVSGYARPGELLAVMGASGSGKTLLLSALGDRLTSDVSGSGDIRVNGRRQRLGHGACAFVPKDDVLIGVLSVRECIQYGALLRLPRRMTRAHKTALVDEVISSMGLTDCASTPIGNWHLRGVSGGQRRRVSIAMELITRPSLLLLDEPTSGLDSAAAFHVLGAIRTMATRHNRTVVSVLHQPSSEVFALVDRLCLLSRGRLVFFGDPSDALPVFEDAGAPCPEHMNVADHFLHATNTEFATVDRAAELNAAGSDAVKGDVISTDGTGASDALIELGKGGGLSDRLREAFDRSAAAAAARAKIDDLAGREGALVSRGRESDLLFWVYQTWVLTCRSWKNMTRNIGVYWLRVVMYLGLTLCIGTIYLRLGTDYASINARVLILGFITGFYGFMSIAGFPGFIEDIKVFQRERLNGYYSATAFVVSNFLASLPIFFFIGLTNALLGYWTIGLRNTFGAFAFFVLQMSASLVAVESVMSALAVLTPNYTIGMIVGAGYLGLFILTCGYFALPAQLPNPVWKYPAYYLSVYTYLFQGFLLNEFQDITFDNKSPDLPSITSQDALAIWGIPNGGIFSNKWYDFAMLWAWAFAYRALFLVLLRAREVVNRYI